MSHGASLHHRSMAGSLYTSAPRSARRFAVARRAAGRETDTERHRGPEPDGRERRERHEVASGLWGPGCGCRGERRVETARRGAAPSTAGCHVTAAAQPPPPAGTHARTLYCKLSKPPNKKTRNRTKLESRETEIASARRGLSAY